MRDKGRVGGPPNSLDVRESRSLPFIELALDRERRLDEKSEVKLDDLGLSVLALEERLELSSGCFFVRRREFLS